MKPKIRKNLILRVDYEREKTVSGILLNKHKFYLIGILAVFITYQNGKKEISKLMVKEEIPIGDPQLRNMLGAKATDLLRVKKYESEINIFLLRLEGIIKKIIETGKFNNQSIKSIQIIKIE